MTRNLSIGGHLYQKDTTCHDCINGNLNASGRLRGHIQGVHSETCCSNTLGRIGVSSSCRAKETLENLEVAVLDKGQDS
jgi:hypothetical protein